MTWLFGKWRVVGQVKKYQAIHVFFRFRAFGVFYDIETHKINLENSMGEQVQLAVASE